jgi:hypothetical protein
MRRRLPFAFAALLAPLLFAVPATAASAPPGPEGIPLQVGQTIAPSSTAATGKTVDGISCQASEQVVYHVHTHLAIYVKGKLRPVPAGVGLVAPVGEQTAFGPFYGASRCYYWLHVHTFDGVIHIESPTQAAYTLGQFFDIWHQQLSKQQVGPAKGAVTAYVNGKRYTKNPRAIVLGSRVDIQLDVGRPLVAFQRVDWSKSQL